MDVCEWLRIHEPDFYSDGNFKLVPRWGRCNNMLRIMLENNDTAVE
jgi:hypothetical protein